MKYTYKNKEGEIETVGAERWRWQVEYVDGTVLKQFGDDGRFHRMDEIQQYRAKSWSLVHESDPTRRIDFLLPGNAKLIHGYKRYGSVEMTHNADGSVAQAERVEHVVYKFGIEVAGVKMLNYVLPDDRIIQSTRELTHLVTFT